MKREVRRGKWRLSRHTLTLRTSNDYDVDKDGLTLKNEAEYASFVESKGYDVLSGAALHAEKRLKEEFEK